MFKGDDRLEYLEETLKKLHSGDKSGQTYYDLLVLGYRLYKSGIGVPHESIYEVISKVTGVEYPGNIS